MPFDLLLNNLSGASVVDQPGGLIPGSNNWIDPYNYAMVYQPDLMAKLHFANGRGKLFKFIELMAKRSTYAADSVQHSEMGRLQNKLKAVNCAVNTFSFTATATQAKHNVRVNDTILIFTGTAEYQAPLLVARRSGRIKSAGLLRLEQIRNQPRRSRSVALGESPEAALAVVEQLLSPAGIRRVPLRQSAHASSRRRMPCTHECRRPRVRDTARGSARSSCHQPGDRR